MKRYLLILFIIISLLVSCSTTQVKKSEPQAEAPKTEAQATPEAAPAAEQPAAPEAAEEKAPETEVPAETEEIPAEEEQPVAEQEVTEEVPVVVEVPETVTEQETPAEEQDWSQVIGAAPSEQAAQAPAEEEKAPETPAAEPETEAPKAAKTPAPTPARKASFVDRLISIIKKVGTFISNQILLSIGIFVCFGGFIYLIVVLAVSARREKERRNTYGRKAPKAKEESGTFRASQDKDPESDDEFLKSLLGDDNL